MMAVLHGYLQKAHRDANAYQVKPGLTWGFVVWRQFNDGQWKPIAHVPDKIQAEEIACERLAKLTE